MDFSKISVSDLFSLEPDGISIKVDKNSLTFYPTYKSDNTLVLCNEHIWMTGMLTPKQVTVIMNFINQKG